MFHFFSILRFLSASTNLVIRQSNYAGFSVNPESGISEEPRGSSQDTHDNQDKRRYLSVIRIDKELRLLSLFKLESLKVICCSPFQREYAASSAVRNAVLLSLVFLVYSGTVFAGQIYPPAEGTYISIPSEDSGVDNRGNINSESGILQITYDYIDAELQVFQDRNKNRNIEPDEITRLHCLFRNTDDGRMVVAANEESIFGFWYDESSEQYVFSVTNRLENTTEYVLMEYFSNLQNP